MAKVSIPTINSGFVSTTALNTIFETLEEELNEKVLYRDNPVGEPNTMESDLDMNGNRILNVLAQAGDGFIWQGAWDDGVDYELNNLVYVSSGSYAGSSFIAKEDHTSSAMFDTDYLAGKWETLAQRGGSGAGSGDMLAANNLSDVADAATSLSNLGGAASGINTDITALNGLQTISTSTVTVDAADTVLIKDASDGNLIKGVTAQDIADLTVLTYASAAENAAGTVENKIVDPLGIREALNATGSTPVYAPRAWVSYSTLQKTGTYSQSGTTITITMASHGLSTGYIANLNFTSGTAVDQEAAVITVTGTNTYTVTAAGSLSTSGNVTLNNYIKASGNIAKIVDNGTGNHTIHFTTPFSTANIVCSGTCDAGSSAGVFLGPISDVP